MNRKKRIELLLSDEFSNFTIKIIDNSYQHIGHNNITGRDETHIELILTSLVPNKFDRLSIHRKINELLKSEFNNGLHSLEIRINKF